MKNRIISIKFLVFISQLAVLSSVAQNYLPTSTTNQIVKHANYALSYAELHEQAEWVAYRLTCENLIGNQSRTDNFRPNPWQQLKQELDAKGMLKEDQSIVGSINEKTSL